MKKEPHSLDCAKQHQSRNKYLEDPHCENTPL